MTETRSGWSSSPSARATTSTTVDGRNAPATAGGSVGTEHPPGGRGGGVVGRASTWGESRGVGALGGGWGMFRATVRGRRRAQDLLVAARARARGDAARRSRLERVMLE